MKVNGYTGVALCACIVCLFTLAACGSKTDANEKNFRLALTQYLSKKGDMCLNIWSTGGWPVDVPEQAIRLKDKEPNGTAAQMAALESVGLVKAEDAEVPALFNGTVKVKRYTLTDAAKPFIVETTGALGGKSLRLCWGKRVLDEVVKWDAPGDHQETRVTYTYTISNIAEWAKKPEVQAAFKGLKDDVDGASAVKKANWPFHLTNQGWEANGLD